MLLARQQRNHRILDTVEEGVGVMICKNSIETYTRPYVKQIVSRSLLCDTWNLTPWLCHNLEGRIGWEVEGSLREGPYIYLM